MKSHKDYLNSFCSLAFEIWCAAATKVRHMSWKAGEKLLILSWQKKSIRETRPGWTFLGDWRQGGGPAGQMKTEGKLYFLVEK
jgi:hypothetical protein